MTTTHARFKIKINPPQPQTSEKIYLLKSLVFLFLKRSNRAIITANKIAITIREIALMISKKEIAG